MEKLLKKNKANQIVVSTCPYDECIKPCCYDCAFASHNDILEIMSKLYKYEGTGLVFEN